MPENVSITRFNRFEKRVAILEYPIDLDVGCGDKNHRHGRNDYVGMDIVDYGQEIVWDVEKGIPLPDRSVNNIFTSHVLEHVEDLIGVMNEFWRVLVDGGELKVVVPHVKNAKAYYPEHIRFFNKFTFKAFESKSYDLDYGQRSWILKELTVNDKPDIHCRMTPRR